MELGEVFLYVFLILILIGGIFEVGILVYAYTHADEVNCNFLWCTFTIDGGSTESHTTISSSTKDIITSQICTVNSVLVNCSEIEW